MKKEGLLSIILPAFNEEKIIKKAANVIGSKWSIYSIRNYFCGRWFKG